MDKVKKKRDCDSELQPSSKPYGVELNSKLFYVNI
jgi:hypothetical protein